MYGFFRAPPSKFSVSMFLKHTHVGVGKKINLGQHP
jgi:hypothetical protein